MSNSAQSRTYSSNVYSTPPGFVQIKATWAEDWKTIPYIEPLSLSTHAMPSKDEAVFLYRYGRIQPHDTVGFRAFLPSRLTDYYIRYIIKPNGVDVPLWTGTVVDESYQMHGSHAANIQVSGDQLINAVGLEHLLDRYPIKGAWVELGTTLGAGEQYVKTMPTFNKSSRSQGEQIIGNRSEAVDPIAQVHLFSEINHLWSNLDILAYLIKFWLPADVLWVVSGQYQQLEHIKTVHKFEGFTMKQALDILIDRHRGFTWHLRYGNDNVVYIHISTVFGSDINVEGDVVLQANPEQYYLDLTLNREVEEAIVKLKSETLYNTIIVSGEPVETCCSLSLIDNTLAIGWSPELEAEYLTGIQPTDPEDPGKCDEARRADRYESVFQRFTIPQTWNGLGYGYATGTLGPPTYYNALVTYSNTEGLIADLTASLFKADKKFLRYLPILKADSDEFLSPIAFVADPDNASLFLQCDTPGDGENGRPSAQLRMMDDSLSILLKSSINHIYAANHFETSTFETTKEPVFDYSTLIVTANFITDEQLQVIRETGYVSPAPKVLHIQVDDAKLQYIAPNTVLSVQGGNLITSPGEIARDDTDKLRLIAALASGWYGFPRSSIKVTLNNLVKLVEIGSYITTVNSAWHMESVGTVVTGVTYTFSGRSVKTSIETGYFELDAAKIIEIPNIGNQKALGKTIKTMQREVDDLSRRVSNLVDRQPQSGGGGGSTIVQAAGNFRDAGWLRSGG